jgi:hypothetical protein
MSEFCILSFLTGVFLPARNLLFRRHIGFLVR